MATTTSVAPLKINYLTKAQYDEALANNQINENEIYFTQIPDSAEYLCLTGGNVTGPVNFGDSVEIDELTVGNIVINGKCTYLDGIVTQRVYSGTSAPTNSVGTTGDLYITVSE